MDGCQNVSSGYYRILSSDDIQKIHQSTLEALESVGVFVLHHKGLERLAEAGAQVGWKTRRVKLPSSLVECCLKTTPRHFCLAGRDPQNDLVLDDNRKIWGRNGGGPGHVEDLVTGQVREASITDVRDYARLVDALPGLHIVAPIYPQEIPPDARDLRVLSTLFASTSKHINMRILSPASLPYIIQMAEIVAGNRENLAKRPLITMLESPISPLKIPEVLVDTLWTCGEYGIPVEICSMPITGATGPITLAGSLLMSNIEMIASVVISQLAHPGAPVIFAPRIMVMDMATGHALTGSMENAMLASAGAQLAREMYHIPVNMHGPYTDSITSDIQAGIENSYFALLPALAGANIITGAGHLEGGLFVSYTQLLLDHELMGMISRLSRSFVVDGDTLALDAIARSIESSDFFVDPHTVNNLRKEPLFRSKLLTREPRQSWLDKGAKKMDQRARERVMELLRSHEPIPMDPNIQKALDRVKASLNSSN